MKRRSVYTIDEIKDAAITRLPQLAAQLAPRGKRVVDEWVAINPARMDRKAGSFKINIKTGLWSDFASGDKGDVIDLVAYLATGGDKKKAIVWLKDWLGMTDRAPDAARAAQAKEAIKQQNENEDRKREARRSFAWQLFADAVALNGNDPASLYLAARGIDVMALAEGPPRSLRYHPRVQAPDGSHHAALLACVSLEGVKNGFAGVHRIFLAESGGKWVKAFDGEMAKMALGSIRGGCVRLTQGASRKRLVEAPAGEWPVWTEGIEDGLAIALSEPHRRVLAGPTLSNLGAIVLPQQLGGLIVVRDNDAPGSPADNQLMRAVHKLVSNGLRVKLAHMPQGFKDANDVLLSRRAG